MSSKVIMKKLLKKIMFCCRFETSRIRIRYSEVQIRIRTKMSRIHNTGSWVGSKVLDFWSKPKMYLAQNTNKSFLTTLFENFSSALCALGTLRYWWQCFVAT
jgi:hypothetical protein